MSFVKTFKYDSCRTCKETVGKSDVCESCVDSSRYERLYCGDENCVHNIFIGKEIVCVKCGGRCL